MSTDPNFTNFVGLSAVLTGYQTSDLAPAIDPIGLASEYLGWIMQHLSSADQQTFLQMLNIFQSIATQSPPPDTQQMTQEVEQQILSNPAMASIARRIIRLWYLSTWYTTEPPDPNLDGQVVSMNAYTLGLAWDAAQAHPMGYSELHFGYWAQTPPPNDVSPNSFPAVNTSPAPATEAAAKPGIPQRALQRGGI
jgi:hypothetical protein